MYGRVIDKPAWQADHLAERGHPQALSHGQSTDCQNIVTKHVNNYEHVRNIKYTVI